MSPEKFENGRSTLKTRQMWSTLYCCLDGDSIIVCSNRARPAICKEANVCHGNDAPIIFENYCCCFFPDIGLNSIKYAIRLMEGTWNPERIFL